MPSWYICGNERFRGPVFTAAGGGGATTWDPANKTAHVALSGSNLIVTATGTTVSGDGTRTTNSHTTGKYYSEHVLDPHVGGGTNTGIAILDVSFTLGAAFMGADSHSYGWYTDGNFYTSGASAQSGYLPVATDVLQLAVDVGNKLIWFNRNNVAWVGAGFTAGDPVAGTNGASLSTLTGAIYLGIDFETLESGSVWTSNFGPTYTYTAPSGYGDW